ncbi:regulatory protein RecX [Cohnella cholangitidis]|uniref:Regulatory protein RecX n=1 Tax=Cohnella cholangitidis TaxID=2598458 RepID=A0A7G5BT11_9BACL|nr:regulatory protein RecX [Cohnella cholangitidis]QMV40095.1 regulatory protein RecX [Cohnella cholangitidis]
MYKPRKPGKSRTKDSAAGTQGNPMNLPVLGAEVVAIESHPKKTHMYWVTLKLDLDESAKAEDVEQRDGDWNEEVDALISGAQSARRMGAEVGTGTTLTVHEDTLVSWRLLKGRQLTAADYEVLKQDEQKEDAYRAALVMLERQARTTAELSRALKRKGYVPEVVAACLERLQARRMVDDTAYAKRFTEQRAVGQRKGRMLIRQELQQRGVGREDIEQAIGELDGQVEQDAALALARKRWSSTKGNDRERKLKLMGVLLRRGFPSGVARSAVQQASSELGETASESDYAEDYDDGVEYLED